MVVVLTLGGGVASSARAGSAPGPDVERAFIKQVEAAGFGAPSVVACDFVDTTITCFGAGFAAGIPVAVMGTLPGTGDITWTVTPLVPDTPESSVAPASASVDAASLTTSQQNARRSAESYLEFTGFSREGLIKQLSSEHGDQYSVEDATAAVDSLVVDWNEQAARSAESYLSMMGFSCKGLIDQLSSEHGDKYTVEQATYGATKAGICS